MINPVVVIESILEQRKREFSSSLSQLVGLPAFPSAAEIVGGGGGGAANTQDFMVYSVIDVISKGYGPDGNDIGRGESFVLPPPLQILDLDSADWQATEYYVYAKALSEAYATAENKNLGTGLMGGLEEIIQQGATGLFSTELASNWAAIKAKSGDVYYTAASIIKQASFNPNVELLYKAPKLRQIQLQWKISPLNETDSTNIYNFIRKMKLYMYPESSPDTGWMGYPARFTVQIKTSNNTISSGSSVWAGTSLFSMGKSTGSLRGAQEIGCVLTDLQVEFGEGGMYAGHKDHSPSTVSINASFTESTLLTREKVQQEYGLRNL